MRRAADRFLVQLSDSISVELSPPADAQATQVLMDSFALLRQRAVSEEDGLAAVQAFKSLVAPPTAYAGAHLCLADVYLSGASPEHGKDAGLALDALIAFLVEDSRDHYCAEDVLFHVHHAIAQVSAEVPPESLAHHRTTLLQLAQGSPVLRATALKACLARLSVLEGAACAELAQHSDPQSKVTPSQMLEELLLELGTAGSEISSLQRALEAERSTRLANLAAAQEQQDALAASLQAHEQENQALELALRQQCEAYERERHEREALEARLEQRDDLIVALRDELARTEFLRQERRLQQRFEQQPSRPTTGSSLQSGDFRRGANGWPQHMVEPNDENLGFEVYDHDLHARKAQRHKANMMPQSGQPDLSSGHPQAQHHQLPRSGSGLLARHEERAGSDSFRFVGNRVLTPNRSREF